VRETRRSRRSSASGSSTTPAWRRLEPRRWPRRGFGDAAIRYDLEHEGVAGELVEQALAGLTPERDRARALVERRGGGRQGAEARTARWLASKGFDAASVEDALGGFAEDA